MVLYRSIFTGLASCLLMAGVSQAFAPAKTATKELPITANQMQAFKMPDFFGGVGAGANGGDKSTKTTIVAGATGYIGKSTVRESVRQGYNTIALVRDKSKVESPQGKALYGQFFEGATVVECDVCDMDALTKVS
jgi:hypothetical protein